MSDDTFPFFSEPMKDIILFRRKLSLIEKDLIVKPLHLPRDINTIHQWVTQPYAKEFWQMDGPVETLYHHYEDFLNSGTGYSLMFFLDDHPVAQIDYYKVSGDEVKIHYEYEETDFGIHLLMGTFKSPVADLSKHVMITALAFLFSLDIRRIIGEPDARNIKANNLVQDVGFRFIKQIEMSYKTANFYIYDKNDFMIKYQDTL